MKTGPKLGGEFIFDWLIWIYEKLRFKFVLQILLTTNLNAVIKMKHIMKDVPLCIYWVKATGLLATAMEINVLLQTQPTLQTALEQKSPLVLQSFWLFSTKSWLEWLASSFLTTVSFFNYIKGQIKLKSRLESRKFSQKTNEWIWFVCLEE